MKWVSTWVVFGQQGLVYLAIFITPLLQRMFKTNFQPLLNDLERWYSLPLSAEKSLFDIFYQGSTNFE